VLVWSATTGQLHYQIKPKDLDVVTFAIHPSSQALAVLWRQVGVGRVVHLKTYYVAAGKDQWAVTLDTVFSADQLDYHDIPLVFSPDGKYLAVPEKGVVHVLDAFTGKERFALRGGAADLAFSPDSKRLAGIGGLFSSLQLWDMATGQEVLHLFTLTGHKLFFSPDGQYLIGQVDNKAFMRWDATPLAGAANLVRPRRRAPGQRREGKSRRRCAGQQG
jgi:WD40 repeat protein